MYQKYKSTLYKQYNRKELIRILFDTIEDEDLALKFFIILNRKTYTGKNTFYFKYIFFNEIYSIDYIIKMEDKDLYPELYKNKELLTDDKIYVENVFYSELNLLKNNLDIDSYNNIELNNSIKSNNKLCYQWEVTFNNEINLNGVKCDNKYTCESNSSLKNNTITICFTYIELLKTFMEKDPINPYNKKKFDIDFSNSIKYQYRKELNMFKAYLNMI